MHAIVQWHTDRIRSDLPGPGWLTAVPVMEATARGDGNASRSTTDVATSEVEKAMGSPGNDGGASDHRSTSVTSFNSVLRKIRLHEIGTNSGSEGQEGSDDWPPLRYGLYSLEMYVCVENEMVRL